MKEQIIPALIALLSSSCCIIQLILNMFSISCAGFAIFTPYRGLLTSLTVLMLSYSIYKKGIRNGTVMISVLICMLLMMSPEIVKNRNEQKASIHTTTSYFIRLHLDGLGCEACANRIKNELNSVDWIFNTRVYFDNKTAIIETFEQEGWMNNDMVKLIQSIDSKYDAQVLDSWVLLL
ncbi:hypothetical protein BD770DRAFT_387038 [Pilaira anomala]|nr:hypothetical protein BD770DRAFT_387038 [Pilaira anomala]